MVDRSEEEQEDKVEEAEEWVAELGWAEAQARELAEARAVELALAEAPVEELVQVRAQEQAGELAQDMVVESAVGLAEAPVEAPDMEHLLS